MSGQQLENDIWRACDIMRRDNNCGGVMEYVEHLSWLLFLKFLDEQDRLLQDEAEFEGRVSSSYTPVLTAPYCWSDWTQRALGQRLPDQPSRRTTPEWDGDELMRFVRGQLIPHLAELRGSSEREVVAGIFSERNVIVCASPYNLKDVLAIVDEINFINDTDRHTVSRVYESLLRRLGHENKLAGEFYTPRPIIRFMVQALDPQIGETVYDPACGSAGFLVEAFEYLRDRHEHSTRDHEKLQRETFYGNEKKSVPALLGTINMVVHGVFTPHILRRNTLEENIRNVADRYDIVLTNPPFGGTENDQIQDNFPIKSNATELLFLEHIAKKLKPGDRSRCALVVPEGTLFRGGAFASVKQDLLTDFNLYLVVSLPPGAFSPYSDVKTALLFFERPGPTVQTLYYELPLPANLKKYSKGKPVADEHFDLARELLASWQTHRRDPRRAVTPFEVPEHHRPWAWLEDRATLTGRGYDLSARNPHRAAAIATATVDELLADLVESSRNLTARLEAFQARLAAGKELYR